MNVICELWIVVSHHSMAMNFVSRASVLGSVLQIYSFLLKTHSCFGLEILTSSDISVKTTNSSSAIVTFRALGQNFILSLCQDADILHPQAVAKLVDGHNVETDIPIHRNRIFSGIANGMAEEKVNAAEVNGVWIIHIRSSNNLVSVEPLRWYSPRSDSECMVVYEGFYQPHWNFALQQHAFVSSSKRKVEDIPGDGKSPNKFCNYLSDVKTNFDFGDNSFQKTLKSTDKVNSNARLPPDDVNLEQTKSTITGDFPHVLRNSHKASFHLNEKKANDLFKRRKRKSSATARKDFLKLGGRRYDLEWPNYPGHNYFNETLLRNSSFQKRLRRSTESATSSNPTECDMLAIVDFNLFRQLGSDPQLVISALTIAYKYTDKIFRKAKFGDVTNCGIVIKEFRIYTDYSDENKHFNSRGTDNVINSRVYLDTMRNSTGSSYFYNFCLVHLNCKKTFSRSEAGMSYWAQVNDDDWSAGVCGVYYDENLTPTPSNLLVTTEISDLGIWLIDYALAIGHEIGHALGSNHDDWRNGCNIGTFLMKSRALPGNAINSVEFSPCSVESISELLQMRRKGCFQDSVATPSTCLNYFASVQNSQTHAYVKTLKAETPIPTDSQDLCCLGTQTTNAPSNVQHSCCLSNCTMAPAGYPCGTQLALRVDHSGQDGVCLDIKTCKPVFASWPSGTSGTNQRMFPFARCMMISVIESRPWSLKPCVCHRAKERCVVCCQDASIESEDGEMLRCKNMKIHHGDILSCSHGTCRNERCTTRSDAVKALSRNLQMQSRNQVASGSKVIVKSCFAFVSSLATTFWRSNVVWKRFS